MRSRAVRVALAFAVGLLAQTAAVSAQVQPERPPSAADVAAARDLFREGSELAKRGEWNEARAAYERSLKLKRAALTYYSLAVAEEHVGRLVEALEHYRAFLAEPASPTTKPWEAPARESIALLEKRVARLRITIDPPTAAGLVVKVDGEAVPTVALDQPRLVNPGAHEVVAVASGWDTARATTSVGEGGSEQVRLTLVRLPEQSSSPAASPLPTTSAVSSPTQRGSDVAEAPGSSRAVPLALLGGGGALLASGIVIGLIGLDQASSAPTRDGDEADAARAKGVAADILAGSGIVAIGIGAIVLLTQSPTKKTGAGVQLTPRGVRIVY